MKSKNDDAYEAYIRQRREDDDDWVASVIAHWIYSGDMTYGGYLAMHPTPEDKKRVDKYLRVQLIKNGEKIIPGFND